MQCSLQHWQEGSRQEATKHPPIMPTVSHCTCHACLHNTHSSWPVAFQVLPDVSCVYVSLDWTTSCSELGMEVMCARELSRLTSRALNRQKSSRDS